VGTSNTRTPAIEEAARVRRQPHKKARQAGYRTIRHACVADVGGEADVDCGEGIPENEDVPLSMNEIM
jgi:hypothetical protein